MTFGEYSKRVHLFPSFVERLRTAGHHVKYGIVDSAEMKKLTLASAKNIHKLKFKGKKEEQEFDKRLWT